MVEKQQNFWCSVRFGLAVLGFFGFVNLYALRTNLSVAIVCMLNQTAIDSFAAEHHQNFSTHKMHKVDDDCNTNGPSNASLPASRPPQLDGDFVWDKKQKGLALGAFYWGYMITQIPGGLLSERFGARRVIGYSMFVAAICNLLTPVGAQLHFVVLMILRIILGLGEGAVYPSMHALWSQWAPPMERSKLVGFTYAGGQVGNALAFPYTALLCEYCGWEAVFYSMGAFCFCWCIAWMFLSSDKPKTHKRISHTERAYIMNSLEGQVDSHKTNLSEMPWLDMAKSLPVWAIIVGHTAANMGTYLMLTSLPLFMKEVLHFDIKSNGLLSALPYLLYWLMINVAGFTSDFIRKRNLLKTAQVRKLMLFIALGGQSAFFLAAAYCTCGQEMLAVAFVTLAQGISGFQYSGQMVNHVDIAPRYAGTLFGFATFPGILAPSMVAALTPNGGREEWRVVFWVASAILLAGAIFFAMFASGEIQPWAEGTKEGLEKEEEMESLTGKGKGRSAVDDVQNGNAAVKA